MMMSLVSIPHRYAKNKVERAGRNGLRMVSIPHRYAKNLVGEDDYLVHHSFQFLIGTLKTGENVYVITNEL